MAELFCFPSSKTWVAVGRGGEFELTSMPMGCLKEPWAELSWSKCCIQGLQVIFMPRRGATAPASTSPGCALPAAAGPAAPLHGRGVGGPSPCALWVQVSWSRIPLAGCCWRVQRGRPVRWSEPPLELGPTTAQATAASPAPGVRWERGWIRSRSWGGHKPAGTQVPGLQTGVSSARSAFPFTPTSVSTMCRAQGTRHPSHCHTQGCRHGLPLPSLPFWERSGCFHVRPSQPGQEER